MASVTAYDTQQGKRWRVQYRDPAGKSRSKRGFTKKGEAQAWAAKNTVALADGDWISPEAKKLTVRDYAHLWLPRLEKRAPGTRRVMKPAWEKYVEPYWGARRVSTIKPSEVQAWADGLRREDGKPMGAVMVRRLTSTLAQILDIAVRDGTIKGNPARDLDLPRKPNSKQVYLTEQQLARLAKEAKYPEIIWLLGTVGLRWGELAGLRVKHVNVLRSRLTIEESATTNGAEVTVGPTKTGEQREVAVPRFVMDMLVPLLEGKGPEAWLWTAGNGRPMRRPSTQGSWFAIAVHNSMHPQVPVDPADPDGAKKRVRDPEFPKITPHGLRHVAAGLMISAGANVKVVQRQLGHATAAVTLDTYAALWEQDLDAVSAAVGERCANVVNM